MTESRVEELQTPCLLIERSRLQANIDAMEARRDELGVRLRPHLKTAKSADVAEAIPSTRNHGITVSTVREAEYFASNGFTDQLYAVCIDPGKLQRLAVLRRAGVQVRLAVDSLEAARFVVEGAAREGVTFDVLIEIDSGEHRSGRNPDDEVIFEIARLVHESDGTQLAGVFTHAGHSYGCRNLDDLVVTAEAERRAVVSVAERLREQGLPCEIVSVGSTPTATAARTLAGVTELRAGVYVFGDLFQVGMGSCGIDRVALTVLATVIGHQPEHGRLLIDAGGLALSKDRSTAALGGRGDVGYGLCCDANTSEVLPRMRVVDAYQEHGVVACDGPIDRFPIGSKLRVMPNHACMTAAAYDEYRVVDSGTVVARWPRVNGW